MEYSEIKHVSLYTTNTGGLGAKVRYVAYSASLLHPPGREMRLLSSVTGMSGLLKKPCLTSWSVVRFLQSGCN